MPADSEQERFVIAIVGVLYANRGMVNARFAKGMSPFPNKRTGKRSWTVDTITDHVPHTPKKEKFNFEDMKAASTSEDPSVRKAAFIEYFERFSEFPSFLFDNAHEIDPRLARTIQDISDDTETSKALHEGITALLRRLPS